ncbi:MAG: ABC transporter ATP-binding protein [Actinomycetota bacterium]|nr:ABC transporter ATP-binding protein [Actinomycetota bacterium]
MSQRSEINMNSLLSIKDLNVSFDTPRGMLEAVRNVGIEIAAGMSVGIVGESGSGKTVLSRAAMGLLQGSNVHRTGTVVFDGHELTAMTRQEVRSHFGTGMAMIFQDPMTALNPVRRIGAQISESLIFRLGMSKKDALKRSLELLQLVRIPDAKSVLRKFPYQLSGGMRQRVMIAIAISCNPKLLFADEPTTALDVTVQAQILQLLRELREDLGMAMVLVTHDLGVVAGNTDYVAVMYAGQVVEFAPTAKLFADMRMPYTEALLESIPKIDHPVGKRLLAIAGRLPDPTDRGSGCSFAPRCKYFQNKCLEESPTLKTDPDGHLYRCFFPIGESL